MTQHPVWNALAGLLPLSLPWPLPLPPQWSAALAAWPPWLAPAVVLLVVVLAGAALLRVRRRLRSCLRP